jgi:glycosyltransferase involved in cell wall biosynthesis
VDAPSAAPSMSVVIPTLNAEKYLDECLEAVR